MGFHLGHFEQSVIRIDLRTVECDLFIKSQHKKTQPALGGGGVTAAVLITASGREGNNSKGVQDFHLEAKARMGP